MKSETVSIRGKTRRDCQRCGSCTMRVLWRTESGKTERHAVCQECHHSVPMGKMDRRVYSMFAPEDADYIAGIFRVIQNTIERDANGEREWVCHNLTDLQSRLNQMPAHLRRKLEL